MITWQYVEMNTSAHPSRLREMVSNTYILASLLCHLCTELVENRAGLVVLWLQKEQEPNSIIYFRVSKNLPVY